MPPSPNSVRRARRAQKQNLPPDQRRQSATSFRQHESRALALKAAPVNLTFQSGNTFDTPSSTRSYIAPRRRHSAASRHSISPSPSRKSSPAPVLDST